MTTALFLLSQCFMVLSQAVVYCHCWQRKHRYDKKNAYRNADENTAQRQNVQTQTLKRCCDNGPFMVYLS